MVMENAASVVVRDLLARDILVLAVDVVTITTSTGDL